ncbi:MAG: L-ribulose-5-phosphate 4-epimerase AraD [Terrimicrobiaceae bacterium]
MSRFSAIREECCAANIALPATGLVDLTFGNVSVCDRESGAFAIKPSGVPYDKLTPGDMVILDLEGNILEGSLRPSSDTPTHRRLFLGFPGIRSVVHTHSRNAVAFAQAAKEIPLLGTTHADYFRGAIPVTRALTAEEIEAGYEWETGNVIVERFAGLSPSQIPAVLVRHHGPFVWGTSGEKAVETAQALEIIAQMAAVSLTLNPAAATPDSVLVDKHFLRKHGPAAYYGQTGA